MPPGSCRPLSTLGRRTFQIYVLHRFVRELAVQADLYEPVFAMNLAVAFAVLTAISLLICTICSWSGFARISDRLLSMLWGFPLREDA